MKSTVTNRKHSETSRARAPETIETPTQETPMNLIQVVVTAVLTTLTILALGLVAVWSLWPKEAEASAVVAAHASGWHSGERSHCDRFDTAHLELAQAVAVTVLDLDDSQQATLDGIVVRMDQWRADAQATCNSTEFHDVDSGLLGLEMLLAQSATTVAELRPQISTLYASLSEEQKAKIEQLAQRHHRHRGGRFAH